MPRQSSGQEEPKKTGQMKWTANTDGTRQKKRAMVIEIHFHLDGWAERFSALRGSVLMWITVQSHHCKIELGCCIRLNPNFQGHHKKFFPNPQTQPLRQTSKRSCNVILFRTVRARNVKLKWLFQLCVLSKCVCVNVGGAFKWIQYVSVHFIHLFIYYY